MITRMEVVSAQPDAPALPMGSFLPNNDPVQIRNIDGLGPVKSEIAGTPFATGRGELFQGSNTPKRNIILTLGLNPNWADQTIMSLRQLLYRYFIPETWSKLRFYSDELPVVHINGITESFEPNLFSEDPEIQISIICPKPDFIDVDTTLITGTTITLSDLTTAGGILPYVIEYEGNAPAGFELHVQSSGSYSGAVDVRNQNWNAAQEFKVNGVTIDSTTYLMLNTVRSLRQVQNILVASPDDGIDILGKMDKLSTWPEFSPGANSFGVMSDVAGLNWILGYFNRYGGL